MPTIKTPADCSDAEIEAFRQLVILGHEVTTIGLSDRIRRAAALAFDYEDVGLVAVAGLKIPGSHYQRAVFTNAGSSEMWELFDRELGWIYVSEDHRRQGRSKALCEALLTQVATARVFATSRADNMPIRRTLERLGFVVTGHSYASTERDYELQLFVR